MVDKTKRAAIYLRQSLDRSGEGVAVARQREDCLKQIDLKRWEFYAEYADNDISAYSGRRRPQFERLLTDAAAGRFDVIVVFHLDRLLRRVLDLQPLIDLGVPIASVTGDLDLSNPTGVLVARLLVSVAEYEVGHKSFRQTRANVSKARDGQPHGGLPPFGFKRVVDPADKTAKRTRFVQVPAHAAAIRRAYRGLLAAQDPASLRGIAREWNAAGLRTARGSLWQPRGVRDCLLGAANAGLRQHNGEIVGRADWKKIVDYQVWADARRLLTDPSRRTVEDNARRYMLAGLAVCGRCGGRMRTGRNSRNQRHTRKIECVEFKHLSLAAEPVEEFLREVVVQRLSRPDAKRLLVESPSARTDRDQRKIENLRKRRDRLPHLFARGAVSEAEVGAAVADLNVQIADLERSVKRSARGEVLRDLVDAKDPADVWDQLDVDRRRAVIDALMTVTLRSPGQGKRTFQPTSVVINWK